MPGQPPQIKVTYNDIKRSLAVKGEMCKSTTQLQQKEG